MGNSSNNFGSIGTNSVNIKLKIGSKIMKNINNKIKILFLLITASTASSMLSASKLEQTKQEFKVKAEKAINFVKDPKNRKTVLKAAAGYIFAGGMTIWALINARTSYKLRKNSKYTHLNPHSIFAVLEIIAAGIALNLANKELQK